MKKHCLIALVLVLTLAVFTGCGCRRQDPAGMKPTNEMTIAPTVAPTTVPTEHTSAPTEQATHATDGTMVPDVTGDMATEITGSTDNTDHTGAMDGTENNNTRARTIR